MYRIGTNFGACGLFQKIGRPWHVLSARNGNDVCLIDICQRGRGFRPWLSYQPSRGLLCIFMCVGGRVIDRDVRKRTCYFYSRFFYFRFVVGNKLLDGFPSIVATEASDQKDRDFITEVKFQPRKDTATEISPSKNNPWNQFSVADRIPVAEGRRYVGRPQ